MKPYIPIRGIVLAGAAALLVSGIAQAGAPQQRQIAGKDYSYLTHQLKQGDMEKIAREEKPGCRYVMVAKAQFVKRC